MRLVKIMMVLALVFAVSAAAYAETQSVKVSGDIALRAFARDNMDVRNNEIAPANGMESTDWATYLLSTAEVQVDADLTDNVSGVVRLVNQRVWGDLNYTSWNNNNGTLIDVNYNGVTANRAGTPGVDAFQVSVDLAYIELKEFLYSPLTLKIGRQDLWFGKGFIIGANFANPGGAIWPQEYSAITSFDAIRATLDYSPWTIDAVFAKIAENARRSDDDCNLWGVNVGYLFDDYNAEAEAYWFFKQVRNPGGANGLALASVNGNDSNDVHTVGGRGSFDPIEDWTIALEGAYQFGNYMVTSQATDRDRSAWAIDAMIECRYWQDDFAWRPVVSAEYIYFSGEDRIGDQNLNSAGKYNAWDPMFRGKFTTAIREFQNVFYRTATASTPSFTNQHQLMGTITVEPTDSLTCSASYAHFWLAEELSQANTEQSVGGELDVNVTWDYTEDVQFGLLTGWFFPGDHFTDPEDELATDIVGTVKLSF